MFSSRTLGHLLFDPPADNLTGVIDFRDIIIGKPARDFIYLLTATTPRITPFDH